MTIRDKYYDDKDVDLKGNDITYHVGTFTIDGDISVSGNLTVSGDFPVGDTPLISDSTGLSLVGNDDWQFINDGSVFFIFNDQYKKISMGYDVENVSMIYSATQRDNPMFSFSGETDWNNYGSGTGNRYLARFQNYANTSGSSGLDIVLNRTDNDITNANIFLNFSGFTGSTFDNSGYIAGLYNDEGLGIYSGNNIRIDAGNDLTLHGDRIDLDSSGVYMDSSSGVIQFAEVQQFFVNSSGLDLDNGIRLRSNYGGSSNFVVTTIATGQRVSNIVKFLSFVDQVGECGSIKGINPTTSSDGQHAFLGHRFNGNEVEVSGIYGGIDGGVSFRSYGGDFGEIFIMGDESEWEFDKNTSISEGVVVYVCENKFYRFDDTGRIPMIVTNRAAFVGNDFNSDERSECLSLIGQINVFVEGECFHGDYIIPKENHCVAVSPKNITFEEYKRAMGVALETKKSEEIFGINCLIGKK
jgi:hypothetical protein